MAERVYRVKERDLLRTNIVDGNVYACTDSRKLYQDVGTKRLLLNAVQISTDKKRIHDTVPSPNTKYYVWETSELWLWKNAWIKLLGNPDYPDAYQYIDGDIYAVGGRGSDTYVDNNGLLGDGGVAVRDYNRVIKGKMYIDETNDNLVVSSFLGGGMKFLPNGNMEETGAIYLDVDGKGLGLHYNDFYNTNGQLFVQYDETHRDEDPSIYPKSSHLYTVWNEGNLDATPLINDELVRKYYEEPEHRGSTNIDNSKTSHGFKVVTNNNDIEATARFSTFNYWNDNTTVLSEISIESQLDPSKNARIYGAQEDDGSYSFYLSYNSSLPVSARELNDLERILNKGEVEQLINNQVRNAQVETVTGEFTQYKVTDSDLNRFLKDGFIILLRFLADNSVAIPGVKININDTITYTVTDNLVANQHQLFFKSGNVYEFVINGDKLVLLNKDVIATNSKFGNVKVTNEAEPTAESFAIVTGTDINLNDAKFRVEGNYALKDMVINKTGFPAEESQFELPASYILSVRTSIEPNSMNNFEQVLTNINENRIYKRSYNTTKTLKCKFEQGSIDGNGDNESNLIYVREKYYRKAKAGENIYISTNLPNNIQFKVFEYDDFRKVAESPWKVANQAYIFATNIKTKYSRLVFRYSDDASRLTPNEVEQAEIKITANGFSNWERMYPIDEEKFVNSEVIRFNRDQWTRRQDDFYEYNIRRNFVTETTLVEGSLDLINRDMIDASYIESYIGGFKVIAKALPAANFDMSISYQKTNLVEEAV